MGDLKTALKLLLQEEVHIDQWQAEDFHIAGCTHFQAQNYRVALKHLICSLRKDPQNLKVLNDYASCLQALSKYKWSEKSFLTCAASGASCYLTALANFYYQLKEFKKSVDVFNCIEVNELSSLQGLYFADALQVLGSNYRALQILRHVQLHEDEKLAKLYLLILRKNGHSKLALNILEHCISENNRKTSLWVVMEKAKILSDSQRFSDAAVFLESVSKQNVNILSLNYEAGAQFLAAKMFQEALRCLRNALKIDPEDVNTHIAMGNCYSELYEYEYAFEHFSHAIRLDVKNFLALFNLGAMHHKKQEFDSAVKCYKIALELCPDHVETLRNLSSIYLLQNNDDGATELLYRLIELHADDVTSFRHLVLLKKGNVPSDLSEYFIRRLSSDAINDGDKAQIHFALFDMFHLNGDYFNAYQHLQNGNSFRRRELKYEQNTETVILKHVKQFFAELPTFDVKVSDSLPQPIFIIGMPRSGTSLVEQLLRQAHEVTAKGELEYLSYSIKKFINETSLPFDVRIQKIRNEYLRLAAEGVDTKYFTDKMPLNFRWVGFIKLCFPNSKIVHVKRLPLPTLWSNYKVYFSKPGNGYIYDWADLHEYFSFYKDLMAFWEKRFGGGVISFSYEDLISSPKDTIESLFYELDFEFSETALSYEKNLGAVNTASFSQVRKGIYSGSNNDWKNYRDCIPGYIVSSYLT